jgi:hypothetical protein
MAEAGDVCRPRPRRPVPLRVLRHRMGDRAGMARRRGGGRPGDAQGQRPGAATCASCRPRCGGRRRCCWSPASPSR